jgi:tetratricopeptide (TPR) repeat protein
VDQTAYFEAYLEGDMTSEEKVLFETRLKEEPLFAEAYEVHLASYKLIKANGAFQLKSLLRQYEKSKYGERRVGFIKKLLAAAVILGMVAILFILLPEKKSEASENLFAAYFTPYRDPVNVRSGADSTSVRYLANESFSAKDFPMAISYYERLPDPTIADTFYYGLSALQVQNADLAISLLTWVSLGQSDYRQQAAWYLSLAFLQDGRKEEAMKVLQEIVKDSTFNHDKARSLVGKLE